MDVPVQYFQSVIAIELAVSGALLWQMRFFDSGKDRREGEALPDARLRVALALVLGATVFGSLWAMADEGPKWAAVAVTIGLAVSLVPILLRVLPPLAKDATTNERDPEYAVTVAGLLLYVVVVAGVQVLQHGPLKRFPSLSSTPGLDYLLGGHGVGQEECAKTLPRMDERRKE